MARRSEGRSVDDEFQRQVLEAALRVGLLGLLLLWCFSILRPFVDLLVWAGIIAVALYPLFFRFRDRLLGGRSTPAAVLFTVTILALVLWPSTELGISVAVSAEQLGAAFQSGSVTLPPPPASVADLPVIGDAVFTAWQRASQSFDELASEFEPQLKQAGIWMLGAAAGAGLGVLKLLVSICVAGAFLAASDTSVSAVQRVLRTLMGDQGAEFTRLGAATVRSVAVGVLGVAVIQSLAAGIGMLWIGVPAAGLLALIVLFLAIVQLPALLVLLPVILYVWSDHDTLPAALFTVWTVVVSLSDSLLKPLLLGRGLDVPMPVIFIGAIGGFILSGFVGLFTGAVVFVFGYSLLASWVNAADEEGAAAGGAG